MISAKRAIPRGFRVNIASVMAAVLQGGRRQPYKLIIDLDNGRIAIGAKSKLSSKQGKLSVLVNWSRDAGELAKGVMTIRCFGFRNQPDCQYVLVVGIPMRAGGWRWRTMCPVTRRWVRNLYFAVDKNRFVSSAGFNRKARRLSFRMLRFHFVRFEWLGDMIGMDSEGKVEKPAEMSKSVFEMIEDEIEKCELQFRLALEGIPQLSLDGDLFDFEVPSCKCLMRNAAQDRSVYFRDKAGVLQLRSRFRPKFGLAGERSTSSSALFQ